jgi:hypothetical protein
VLAAQTAAALVNECLVKNQKSCRIDLDTADFVRHVPGFPVCPRFLGFEAEVNGDRNVRGNGLAVPRRWLVLVFLQGFDSGRAQ